MNNVYKYVLTCSFLLAMLSPVLDSHAQNWSWAISAGGIYGDKATDMAIDKNGGVYVCGYYNVGQPANTTANFGNIVAPGANWGKEGFLAKASPNGTWQWVRSAVGGWDERVLGMCVDNVNGFVYTTGCTWTWNAMDQFTFGSCNFYNNPGASDEIFVGKFDFNGNCQWTIGAGSDGDDHGYDLATDKAGNIYLTGFMSDHYGWFGNPGQFGSIIVPMNTDSVAYVTKISPSGAFQWVRTFEAIDGERDNRIAVDSIGNVYVAGGFRGSKQFGTTTLTSAGDYDVFVVKYNSAGTFQWAKRAGSTYDDRANSITLDVYGDVYVTGEFRDQAIFGTDTINNNGGPQGRDIFVAKMNTSGTWIWAKKAGSNNGSETGERIIGNKRGTLFVTGQFKGNASFGSSITLTPPVTDSIQIFVAAIDTAGKWQWALDAGGSKEDRGTGLACDDSCNIYNAGFYDTDAKFGNTTFSSLGKKDIYLAKIIDACPQNAQVTYTNVLCNGQCNGSATANMMGAMGPVSYAWSTTPPQTTQTASGLCAGTYTVTMTDSAGHSVTSQVTITEPSALGSASTGTMSCNGLCNGTATVTASGGTPVYTYAWSTTPTQTTAIASNLCAASYTCLITDSLGCTDQQVVVIPSNATVNTTVNSVDLKCNGLCYGTATVTATGAWGPFTYSWTTSPPETTNSISFICAGTYSCYITDSSGCVKTEVVTISEPPAISVSTTLTPVSCNGKADGMAALGISGGVAPYMVFWQTNPAQTTTTAIGLAPGTYSVIVSDTNDCSLELAVTLADVTPRDTLAITDGYCPQDPSVSLHSPGISSGPYQWYAGATPMAGANGGSYTVPVGATANYSVTWFHGGCCFVSSALQETIYEDMAALPATNIFTPNTDGQNDLFVPFCMDCDNKQVSYSVLEASIDEYELWVYDRWGILVFNSTQVSRGWNGTDKKGVNSVPGTYYWIARFKSRCSVSTEQNIKGFVQLIR